MNNPTIKPSPLGRGLSALFGDADTSYQPKPAPLTKAVSDVPPIRPAHTQNGYVPPTPASQQRGRAKSRSSAEPKSRRAHDAAGLAASRARFSRGVISTKTL